jgi:hypothetical protein
MANQVQQLTRGRSALESSAGSTVCRATQVMQGNETLAPSMANMQLQGVPRAVNVNLGGDFGRVPGLVPSNATAAAPYNPEIRINPPMNTHSPMEIETTQAIPSLCAGMVTPAVLAYVTPTMRNSLPLPPAPQLLQAFAQLPGPVATVQPGQIIHFAHPAVPRPKQMDWSCQFHLWNKLHQQYTVLKCNNHNLAGLLGIEVNDYPKAQYLRGPHAQEHLMIKVRPGSQSCFHAFK